MATIIGTYGNDFVLGTEGNDNIYGFGGNDFMRGRGGQDEMFGGFGHDILLGGGMSDALHGNQGVDQIDGGAGNDRLWGGDGADTFRGNTESGHDIIWDWTEQDTIYINAPGVDRFSDINVKAYTEAGIRAVKASWGTGDTFVIYNVQPDDFSGEDFLL